MLGQELIERQAPGQSILQTVNLVPGVNFTNSDPYGSSGGNLRIRGFDGNRISLTFDGIPLNDRGNYAIFSNQQLDPELIEQVNVNLGQTDVDSPTASAAGGTVNYRTHPAEPRARRPRRRLDRRLRLSPRPLQLHSGEWWENGPRAFIAYSNARNDLFRGPGEIYKQQFNARIYYAAGRQWRLRLDRRPLQPQPQQFLPQPVVQRPAHDVFPAGPVPGATGILGPTVVAAASTDDAHR